MSFLNSIKNNSKQYNFPFDHWEYSNALSEEAIDEIVKADIPDVSKHNLNYDGTRAIDGGAAEFREGIASGGQAIKFRCFINKENSSQFPNLVKFIKDNNHIYNYQPDKKGFNYNNLLWCLLTILVREKTGKLKTIKNLYVKLI